MARTWKFAHLRILCIVSLASGCSSVPEQQQTRGPFETVELALGSDGQKRPYIVFDNKRYISGPYGDQDEISSLVDTIKGNSTPVTVSNRSINLPNKAANLMLTVYDYTAPDACGGHSFHVYEGDELQILQFDYPTERDITCIRDYTQGPTPFVSPGLWGPYDHTDETAMDMCLLAGDADKDGMGLLEGGYEIGWITNIVDWKQAELGNEYANAVSTTNRCLQRMAEATRSTTSQNPNRTAPVSGGTYPVQPGDTLGTIAEQAYGDFSRWIDIYTENSNRIGPDPNRLPEGITLVIP